MTEDWDEAHGKYIFLRNGAELARSKMNDVKFVQSLGGNYPWFVYWLGQVDEYLQDYLDALNRAEPPYPTAVVLTQYAIENPEIAPAALIGAAFSFATNRISTETAVSPQAEEAEAKLDLAVHNLRALLPATQADSIPAFTTSMHRIAMDLKRKVTAVEDRAARTKGKSAVHIAALKTHAVDLNKMAAGSSLAISISDVENAIAGTEEYVENAISTTEPPQGPGKCDDAIKDFRAAATEAKRALEAWKSSKKKRDTMVQMRLKRSAKALVKASNRVLVCLGLGEIG